MLTYDNNFLLCQAYVIKIKSSMKWKNILKIDSLNNEIKINLIFIYIQIQDQNIFFIFKFWKNIWPQTSF